jgi:hypothetical protein
VPTFDTLAEFVPASQGKNVLAIEYFGVGRHVDGN